MYSSKRKHDGLQTSRKAAHKNLGLMEREERLSKHDPSGSVSKRCIQIVSTQATTNDV
jgi:hypothetical protein